MTQTPDVLPVVATDTASQRIRSRNSNVPNGRSAVLQPEPLVVAAPPKRSRR
jgi:hypothetical protein